jgi:acid phosphatase type 7
MRHRLLLYPLLGLLLLVSCAQDDDDEPAPPTRSTTTVTTGDDATFEGEGAFLYAVGDIADCTTDADEATAAVLDGTEGPIATLGDNAYPNGTSEEFERCFEPGWGRHKHRVRPSPGNHDYNTRDAAGYFGYFGHAAGTSGEGWYSYDVGSWHVVALNSNCRAVGCGRDGPQGRWLADDLATHPAQCTLAYWHHPRFSSGLHGSSEATADLFAILYEAGADVVLAGHDHHYERIRPLDPGGRVDLERGIRLFTVGTGGRHLYPTGLVVPGSEVRHTQTFGVLELRLFDDGYRWRFLRAQGIPFTDGGSGSCH